MPWIESLDWTALNSLRRYPLREGTSALSTDEYFSIPDTLIVDFTLCATSDVSRRFHISKVINKITAITIEISDEYDALVGVFNADKAAHYQDKDYYLAATNNYVGANGKLTIGSFDDLQTQPAGIFYFLKSSTEFEPRTVVPGLQGIDRITFIDTQNGQYSLSGSAIITSRSNLKFSYFEDKVFLDAGDNLGLNKVCAVNNCVKSINGVVPDPVSGDISLLGINCLNITSSAQYTLNLEDTCCTPCSGCDDLEVLTTRLTSLENKFIELKGTYNDVNAQLTNYLATINSNCACPS
jgi:hypothetical protein